MFAARRLCCERIALKTCAKRVEEVWYEVEEKGLSAGHRASYREAAYAGAGIWPFLGP